MLKAQGLKRTFIYSGIRLADINPSMSEAEIKRHYEALYPDLANAVIGEREYKGNEVIIPFKKSVGTKG